MQPHIHAHRRSNHSRINTISANINTTNHTNTYNIKIIQANTGSGFAATKDVSLLILQEPYVGTWNRL